ncbi:acyltransferase family protein [Muriicola sp. Z0-33]|uniref:acyltransferase family protein n=1 Tax=Muriicola sp. Z0-33 TaxID=2816957 RepID=UPI0022390144|nr:acyltransferase [Muriicola sp. Z0-33]MCW5516906.1 acyltransferase [Muriicola sp. Z0-33]
MYSFIEKTDYRKDIDGLRALAVIVVFIFHCGYLPVGYLGVDIFFVISGYLITKIIYLKSLDNKFSILDFYLRRIRRIIPLVSFFCLLTLVVGLFTMLPDDLENLAQSIVATNFFGNNILQYVTTGNYWDVVNEFKPLMHTWSLGIEEQYYFLYPFLFLLLKGKLLRYVLPVLLCLTVISLGCYFLNEDAAANFYLLPSRFYELSIGGIGAVLFRNRLIITKMRIFYLGLLVLLCSIDFSFLPDALLIPLVVLLTLAILITSASQNSLSTRVLENKITVGLGKISFSIYMWHQVLLAFSRYFVLDELTVPIMGMMLVVTLLLSVATYYFIEQPFRDKRKLSTPKVLYTLSFVIILTTISSLFIYYKAGVIKDISELGISKSNVTRGMHALYNDRINTYDRDFNKNGKTKVLVIGDSFGRDWANVLLESKYASHLDLAYRDDKRTQQDTLLIQIKESDIVFWSQFSKEDMGNLILDKQSAEKIWCVGTKNFGLNNGRFYNFRGTDYCLQRTSMEDGYLQLNKQLKEDWQNRYIDLIALVIDKDLTVPVFTENCKFISQDTRHLTKSGAQFFANLIENKSDFVLNQEHFND